MKKVFPASGPLHQLLSRTSLLTVFNPYFRCRPSEGPLCLPWELAPFVLLNAPWLILAFPVSACDFPDAHWSEPQHSAVCLLPRNKQERASLTERLKEAQASIKIHIKHKDTPISKGRKEGEGRETRRKGGPQ